MKTMIIYPKEMFYSLFEDLQKKSGIYFFYNDSELLYIGKAINLWSRMRSHLFGNSDNTKYYVEYFKSFSFFEIKTGYKEKSIQIEKELILKYNPILNGTHNIDWDRRNEMKKNSILYQSHKLHEAKRNGFDSIEEYENELWSKAYLNL